MTDSNPGSSATRDAVALVNALMVTTRNVEARLLAAGESDGHDWMFALREVLLDLQRVLEKVAALEGVEDTVRLRQAVDDVATEIAYRVLPHSRAHMLDVLESLRRSTAQE
jgi:hypothetical protein